MNFEANYRDLQSKMSFKDGKNGGKKGLKNQININAVFLPFVSRNPERAKFKNGFKGVLGEFARLELDKTWDDELSADEIVKKIISEERVDCSLENEKYLEKLIADYLFDDNNDLNILKPSLFLYLPRNENNEKKGEYEIALFIRDVFFNKKDDSEFDEKFKDFFKDVNSNHILIKLILKSIFELPEKEIPLKYDTISNGVVNLFKKDINFLLDKNETYLLNNMELIFAYYYFFYSSQCTLLIDKDFKGDFDGGIEPLYYALDWESISKNRKTIKQGFNLVYDANAYLFDKCCLLSQLNTYMGVEGKLLFELNDEFNEYGDEDKQECLKWLKKWIDDYQYVKDISTLSRNSRIDIPENVDNEFGDVVNLLSSTLYEGVDQAVRSRYSLNIREIAKLYFLKNRGVHGSILNLTQDMFLVITSLCIKEDKIKLNHLFGEYEKRGLFFDKYSKEKIVDLLNNLNLIDKKSDSGDAQYVKSIL